MARTLPPERIKEIEADLKRLSHHTMSEVARILKVTPSTVRHHGNRMGIEFKRERYHLKERILIPEGEFFNEHRMENWLI